MEKVLPACINWQHSHKSKDIDGLSGLTIQTLVMRTGSFLWMT